MKCKINGDEFTFEQQVNIQQVIEALELDESRIIVEHNETLIKREQFATRLVNDEDKLELLEFVGGG
ncbi:thiamine biosynthesis protein ThiS [Staphylococcus xylosus]|uniref:sulfur carrier protein ThiS n=1 Tax=Staphylococcus xylosus TaxID=1288 RepID=UPI000D1DE7A8|nr:sulfur carrier protein ThiS [Staphylococcus xylosus]PTI04948.1 thiamine biosynthesis protein ThiS [Staphylococcus xylosus]